MQGGSFEVGRIALLALGSTRMLLEKPILGWESEKKRSVTQPSIHYLR
jgi:hypothetical protein